RRVCIGLRDGKAFILAYKLYQRIQVRPIENEEKIFVERKLKFICLEKAVRRACKNRNALCSRVDTIHKLLDLLDISFKVFALIGVRRKSIKLLTDLLLQKDIERFLAGLVRSSI